MKSEASKARFWAAVPVILLGSLMTTLLVMMHIALNDPSFAVEDRYYSKALSWDEHLAAERRSAALGWRADVTTARTDDGKTDVTVSLVDRAGKPVQGAAVSMEGFPIVRSRHVVRADFTESTPGVYRASVPKARPGRWELSFQASRGGDRFDTTVHQDLGEGS